MCDKNGISGGMGGGPLCEPILENPEGMRGHRKNPFRGGVWIFSGTAHCFYGTASFLTTPRGNGFMVFVKCSRVTAY